MRRGGWKVDRGLQSQIEDAAEKGMEGLRGDSNHGLKTQGWRGWGEGLWRGNSNRRLKTQEGVDREREVEGGGRIEIAH